MRNKGGSLNQAFGRRRPGRGPKQNKTPASDALCMDAGNFLFSKLSQKQRRRGISSLFVVEEPEDLVLKEIEPLMDKFGVGL